MNPDIVKPEKNEQIKFALILEPSNGAKMIIALSTDKAKLEQIRMRLLSGEYKHHVDFSVVPFNDEMKELVNKSIINVAGIDPNKIEETLASHEK